MMMDSVGREWRARRIFVRNGVKVFRDNDIVNFCSALSEHCRSSINCIVLDSGLWGDKGTKALERDESRPKKKR